ncbi:TAXI family TRAP transporter solute-binding subunit [Otoolea muris]|uniref:TAXI family TRAP transporter solute-binding subunit n=1 Tax=Otoolea muris TaxID=2941515 RepID=UPI00203BEACE|nr:TAXI family TRAP transporter solute-binding subunit [Otoolea muris]
MKKRFTAIAALAVAAAMSLTACTQSQNAAPETQAAAETAAQGSEDKAEEPAPAPAPAPSADAVSLKMATGGTTGTYYAYGGVIANILNGKLGSLQLNVQSTGASKANIFLIDDGEADVAIVQNDVMDYASKGTDLFEEDGAIESFSAGAALYAEVCQIISSGDIKSVEDLKGKRVSVGDAGSGVEFNARQILNAYGISFDDIEVNNLGFGDSADALKDGKIDAFFCTAGAPTTAITELATTNSINLLGIDDEHAAALQNDYAFYTQYTIPGGTYKGVDDDVVTVAVKATLIVSDKLSEDVVYDLVKGLFDNKDAITAGHAKGAELDPAYAVDGISVKFHPGAEKYFKEAGVLQ